MSGGFSVSKAAHRLWTLDRGGNKHQHRTPTQSLCISIATVQEDERIAPSCHPSLLAEQLLAIRQAGGRLSAIGVGRVRSRESAPLPPPPPPPPTPTPPPMPPPPPGPLFQSNQDCNSFYATPTVVLQRAYCWLVCGNRKHRAEAGKRASLLNGCRRRWGGRGVVGG